MDKRIFGLDILRASAIFFVVASHAAIYVPEELKFYYNLIALDGVTMFFVLSGFLIGGILIRIINSKDFNFTVLLDFWKRRWFRTLPNYLLVLSIVIISSRHIPSNQGLFSYFTFTQNFAWNHPSFFGEAWSLAVEEWFYLLIPFILFLSFKFPFNKRKVMLFWILFFMVSISLFRIFKAIYYEYPDIASWDIGLRKQVITRLDSITFGFLLAYISTFYKTAFNPLTKKLMFALGVLILISPVASAFFELNMFYFNHIYLPANCIGTFLIIPFLLTVISAKGLFGILVNELSKISYALYLINYTIVLHLIMPHFNFIKSLPLLFIIFWTISIILSYALYYGFEIHCTRLRDYKMLSIDYWSRARATRLIKKP